MARINKPMTTKLFIALILAGLTLQQCSIGCLKCNNLNQCLLCDATSNYFLNGNTCSLSTQTNCLVLSLTGGCFQCNVNFYLDLNAQRCLAVSNSSLITNCGMYNSGQVCILCTGSFFLQAGRCAAVNSTIANCAIYTAVNYCFSCASGFTTNADSSACVQLPSTGNCMWYTYIGCSRCNTGFINNPNFNFVGMQSPATLLNINLFNLAWVTNYSIGLNVCQATIIANCLTFSTFSNCTQCRSGFFLQNGNCVAFPLAVIFACMNYSTLTTCTTCQAGYFLSSNTCVANTVIANCLTYSGTATTTTCVQCNNGFFLQGNVCANRTLSSAISNCQTVSLAADTCAMCAMGFILTSDARACLVAIANCAAYSASTFQSANLQCSLCANNFYVTTGSNSVTVCVSGTISNCLTYQVNANTCSACNNGFYLSNANTCVQHVNIANCATYDPTKANFCSICNPGFYNFAFTTVCVQTTLISNCMTYAADGNTCISCAANYYVNGGSCTIIPATFANCAIYSGTQCTMCNSGFMVNTLPTVGTCTLPLDYIMATSNSPCAITQSLTSTLTPTWVGVASANQGVITCGTCNDYMYGYAPIQAEAICVNTNQLALYSGFATVTNCLRYGLNYATSPVFVSMQCASGFFISGYNALAEKTVATTCTNTCATDATFQASPGVIVDDMLGFVNICIANTGTVIAASGRCSRYGRTAFDTAVTATAIIADYTCWAVWQSTNVNLPINIMVFDTTLALNLYAAATTVTSYLYESPSASAQVSTYQLTGVGYANTVDMSSLFPNVYNYLGLPAGPIKSNVGAVINLVRPLTTGAVEEPANWAATVQYGNNLLNCDIAAIYSSTGYGNADIRNAVTLNGLAVTTTANYVTTGCLRCAFGYQVSFVGTTAAATITPIPSCVQMSNCASSNTVYGGLPQHLNAMLSCHVCSQANGAALFPTIYFEYDARAAGSGAWMGWTVGGWTVAANPSYLLTVVGTVVTVASGNGFKCAAAPTSIVNSVTPTTTTLTSCGVYGYATGVVTMAPTVVGDFIAPKNLCLACSANFWPTYAAAYSATTGITGAGANIMPTYAVTLCTASLNCDTSVLTQFNGCGKCRTDQENLAVPAFYAFMDLTHSNCYQVATKYCLILSTTGFLTTSTTNACDVCKAGYFMNADIQCEQFRIPNQAINNGLFINAYVASKVYTLTAANTFTAAITDNRLTRLHYLLSFKQLQYGVTGCSSGYTFAPLNSWTPRLCVWSAYVYNNTGSFPTTSNFINNCVRYNLTQVNSKNICGGCTTGFIPTQDGTACVSASTVPNCFYAQNSPNSALCFQCQLNFNNVNGVCTATSIPNCATYLNNRWSFTTPSALTCNKCINGFVLSSDALSCVAGNVANCIQYSQGRALVCTDCATNFVLMTLNAVYYCYPIPASLNCVILQDTSPNSGANFGTVSCATCTASSTQVFGTRQFTALGQTTLPQTLCIPINTISNCNTYDQSNSVIKANTFGCTRCSSGFWYSSANYTCVPRSNQPSQCLTYSNTADVCTVCNIGSFLSVDGTNCVAFPNGIFQCRTYSAASVCTQCNAPFYLSNNACIISTVVPNCLTYNANFTCSSCNTGFFLQNSTSCITATATNCLTFTSLTACASCNTGFGLQTTNGVTNCVQVNLNNCVNTTTIAPFTCITCSTGFFPNSNGVCTTVSTTIPNCLTYDTATTCSVCSSNSVLNVARTVCNSTYFASYADPNCAQNILLNQPACAQCNYGSYFVNGACQSCNNNTFASGCLSCDPTNNNVCLACRPTFYMTATGGCISVSPVVTPTPNPTNNNTNATSTLTKAVTSLVITVAAVYFDWA